MTFKHVKFEDSPTMRALEKVAQEKGLIKSEPRQKTAAAAPQEDFTPSASLMENIFKLCAGLRDKGFHKEAAELEVNYFNYKRAQTLYEAHKETGEDVIHSAHPKGSHKLEGVEGEEATVEDILDKHVKFMQMVEKKPTGKLSSSAHILSSVKKALGQAQGPQQSKEQVLQTIKNNLVTIRRSATRAMDLAESEVTLTLHFWRTDLESKTQGPESVKLDNLKALKKLIGDIYYRLRPGTLVGVSEDAWARIKVDMDQATKLVDDNIDLRGQYNQMVEQEEQQRADQPAAPQQGEPVAPGAAGSSIEKTVRSALATAYATLRQFKITVDNDPDNSQDDKNNADAWLKAKEDALIAIESRLNEAQTPEDKENTAAGLNPVISKITSDFAQFKQQWVG